MEIAGKYRFGPGFGAYMGGLNEMNPQDLSVLGEMGAPSMPPPASFDGNNLFYETENPRFIPGNPDYVGPFKQEQMRDRFILNDPRSGVANAPRYIQSSPPGNIIHKAPHIDSPYIDKAIERRWQPMPAPPPRGPQLPGFV